MARRSGLGKGLDSLIPEMVDDTPIEVKKEEVSSNGTVMIKLTQIEPNKSQPRKTFDQDLLNELAESIKQVGIIQPLVVQKRDGYYEIIAGERRWRAAKLADVKEVPVVIKEYSDREIVEVALIENIQRADLNPIEEALAYKKLIDEYELRQEDLAQRVAKSRTAVTNSMRLLKLNEQVQQMLIDGELSSGHARALLAVENETDQYQLAQKIIAKNMSVREVETLVKDYLNPKTPVKEKKEQPDDFIYKNIENKIKTIVGTKVRINRKDKEKGKIEIDYYSTEDLERLVDLFGKMN